MTVLFLNFGVLSGVRALQAEVDSRTMVRLIRAIDNLLEANTAARTGTSTPVGSAPPPAMLPPDDETQKRYAEQLQHEEEERQRQVEEDHGDPPRHPNRDSA